MRPCQTRRGESARWHIAGVAVWIVLALVLGGAALWKWGPSIRSQPKLAVEKGTMTYVPKYSDPNLEADERLAIYILLTRAGGMTLDESVCRAGGEWTMSFSPGSGAVVHGQLHSNAGFEGYRITLYGENNDDFRSGQAVRQNLAVGGWPNGIELSRLGPNAQISVAVGVYDKKDPNWRFRRFASEVLTAEFSP